MNTTVAINPPVQFYPNTAYYVHVNDVYIHLASQTADAQVTFFDSGMAPIQCATQRYQMDTGTYAGWGGDDNYMLNACLSGLGLNPASGWLV